MHIQSNVMLVLDLAFGTDLGNSPEALGPVWQSS